MVTEEKLIQIYHKVNFSPSPIRPHQLGLRHQLVLFLIAIVQIEKYITKNLSNDSPMPWNMITGMRHKLIHDYLGVDINLVWDTVTKDLGIFKSYLLRKVP